MERKCSYCNRTMKTMEERKYFWTTKNGEKINVDDMTESHLRNVLKMIIRNRKDNEVRGDETYSSSEDLEPYAFDHLWK